VNEAVLRKVLEWCEHHKNDPAASSDDDSDSRKKSTDIEEWDQKYMSVDQEMLFEIILVNLSLHSSSHRLHDLLTVSPSIRPPITSTSRLCSTLAARPLPT
jgi:hypothetical protein